MDRDGLITSVIESEMLIDEGRKWLDSEGFEAEGRLSYRLGLQRAIEAFGVIQTHAETDLELLVLAEHSYLTQELQLCDPADTFGVNSIKQAIADCDDALLALTALNDPNLYRGAEMTHPHKAKYRYKEMPRDAFHITCISHRARISNSLRTTGLNLLEKELLKQRSANFTSAQAVYLEKQKTVIALLDNVQHGDGHSLTSNTKKSGSE